MGEVLAELAAPELAGQPLLAEWRAFVTANRDAALLKHRGRAHLTASCFVFDQDLERIALTFHRRGQFWVQFGGHIEPTDSSLAAAAIREALEESGLTSLAPPGPVLTDLDRHDLVGAFECDTHWDVGYWAIAGGDQRLRVSDESEQVAWWPCDQLPTPLASGMARRTAQALAAATRFRAEFEPR